MAHPVREGSERGNRRVSYWMDIIPTTSILKRKGKDETRAFSFCRE